jgi:hypothetical protein
MKTITCILALIVLVLLSEWADGDCLSTGVSDETSIGN